MSNRIKVILMLVCSAAALQAACDPLLGGGGELQAPPQHQMGSGGNPNTGINGLAPAALFDAFPVTLASGS